MIGSAVSQHPSIRTQIPSEPTMRSAFTRCGPNCEGPRIATNPAAHGWHTWVADVFFIGTSDELQIQYPMNEVELATIPRRLLARIYQEFKHLCEEMEASDWGFIGHKIINKREIALAQYATLVRIGEMLGKAPFFLVHYGDEFHLRTL
jgi:hypothetical protein